MSQRRTLFSEIQGVFERTYASVGINLEDCLIDGHRCRQLSCAAGASARELSDLARTFLRRAGGQLYIGIYYSSWLIEQLERHDPRAGLSEENIRDFIAFVEEINHALHAALKFQAGHNTIEDEKFACNLELQGMIDTYMVLLLFVAFFRKAQRISRMDRRWIRYQLFERQNPSAYRCETLRGRYMEATSLARRYTAFLDGLNGARRIDEIRRFHALDYDAKRALILALPGPPP
jgi:hypothetical protein